MPLHQALNKIVPAGTQSQASIDRIYPLIFTGRDDSPNLSDRGMLGLLLLAAEKPVGCFVGRTMGEEGEIISMGVIPEYRRQGRGNLLLISAKSRLAAEGVKSAFLEVACDNAAAIGLYKKHGFTQVGKRPGYCVQGRSQPADAIVMRCDL